MPEDKKEITTELNSSNDKINTEKESAPIANVKNSEDLSKGAAKAVARSVYGAKRKSPRKFKEERRDEFEQRILDVARVTRVMAGGKRMRFRVCVVIGDKKGKVGVALGKGADVTMAVNKAVNKAKKELVSVSMTNGTIPHEIFQKFGAAKILFKPASEGKGVIAGGIVRVILEMAGVQNISSKILGTNNKINNAVCTIEALKNLRQFESKKTEESNKNNKEKEITQ
jgi:small subunit ribosomal protein S5